MNRTPIRIDPEGYPQLIRPYIRDCLAWDSSCSDEARVIYLEKEGGLFLKEAASGTLKREAEMTAFFHTLGLSAEVLGYLTEGDRDYMLTRRIPGEDCTHPSHIGDPERLCDTMAVLLRSLHETDPAGCPVPDRNKGYIARVKDGFDGSRYEPYLFEGICEFGSLEEAKQIAEEGFPLLKRDALLHGDYCLPNILLDGWRFTGFIDLDNGGVGDRHIDLAWGVWSLNLNLGTSRYTQRFLDAYGRDKVEPEKLKAIAAMESIGG